MLLQRLFQNCIKFVPKMFFFLVALLFIPMICSKELAMDDFDALLRDKQYMVIYFYSPSCTLCSKISPEWVQLEKLILSYPNSKLVVGQVDCGIHRDLCSREDVQEIPTIKLYVGVNYITRMEFTFPNDKTIDFSSLQNFLRAQLSTSVIEGGDEEFEEDSGNSRDDSDSGFKLVSKSKLTPVNGLYELGDEDIDLFLSSGEHFVNFYAPWCKYCKSLEPIWESLAELIESDSVVKLSKVDCTQNVYSCKLFTIKEYPTLLWISNGKILARYKGMHTITHLKAFINSQLADYEFRMSTTYDEDFETEKLGQSSKKHGLMLNNENFSKTISTGFTFIHFTVPWSKHCLEMKPEWDKLASKVTEKELRAKIGQVDCSTSEKICNDEHIDSYPTLHLYSSGYRHEEFNGNRNLESFMKYLEPFLHFKEEL